MNKYYKIYPISGDETNVEVVVDTKNYNLNGLDDKTLDNLIDILNLLMFEDKTDEDEDDIYIMPEMKIAFNKLAEETKEFLQKYYNPHTKIVADISGIEVVQGVLVKSFELND